MGIRLNSQGVIVDNEMLASVLNSTIQHCNNATQAMADSCESNALCAKEARSRIAANGEASFADAVQGAPGVRPKRLGLN